VRERGQKAATYEDVLNAPLHCVAEVIAGELHLQPRPRFPHARSASRLGVLLGPADLGEDGRGNWIILDEPELHLADDILVLDLAGWRRETMPDLPDQPFSTVPPDWLCEVLSPSTAKRDRADKVPIYARERVRHIWMIDPELRTLEVLRLDGDTYRIVTTQRDDAVCRLEPFEEIELRLARLWSQ